jgi:uracil-DNA glycosylase
MLLAEMMGWSWFNRLKHNFASPSFKKVSEEYNAEQLKIPAKEDVFRAFRLCPFEDVKVVIVDYEPRYKNGADGLALSSKDPFERVDDNLKEYFGTTDWYNTDLTRLAEQGVLLLNQNLTVGFQNGVFKNHDWTFLTNDVIKQLDERKEPVVFISVGCIINVKSKVFNIDGLLEGELQLSIQEVNEVLKQHYKKEIKWKQ